MKFLADMGISPKTITFLQQLGYESIHLFSLGLHQLPDSKILKKARNEGYILLTHDLDFGELVAASQAKLPSVIIFRLKNMHPDEVNRHLNVIITNHTTALEQGVVISVTNNQIRLRSLPIKNN